MSIVLLFLAASGAAVLANLLGIVGTALIAPADGPSPMIPGIFVGLLASIATFTLVLAHGLGGI